MPPATCQMSTASINVTEVPRKDNVKKGPSAETSHYLMTCLLLFTVVGQIHDVARGYSKNLNTFVSEDMLTRFASKYLMILRGS